MRKTQSNKKFKTTNKMVKKQSVRKSAVKDFTVGYTNEIYKVIQVGRTFAMLTTQNQPVTKVAGVSKQTMKKAMDEGKAIQGYVGKTGKLSYKMVEMDEFKKVANVIEDTACDSVSEAFETHDALKEFIHTKGKDLKPNGLFIEELKWKYLLRSAVRGKNILMTGPTGCGKTLAAQSLVKSLKRPDYYFNLGATQDARATLIGNTHFDSKKGTFFAESAFVKAISTPNAVILLDELSRAHPDAWNILMSVLDLGQRYLRLDEAVDSPIVNVAEGVTFIATANIGGEYTSTRVLDRAILDRFTTIEMDVLNDEQEFNLLKYMYPQVSEEDLKAVAEISTHTRDIAKTGDGKLSTGVSTRASVETAGLLYDGFSLFEAAEISMFPFFSNDGGVDSERTYVKQLVQKYIKDEKADEALFTEPTEDDSEKIVW